MAMEKKDRTHRLGRVPAEVYEVFKSKADGSLSDTTLFSDLLSHLAGMPTRAEKLKSVQEIVALMDPKVLRMLADAAEVSYRQVDAEQQAGQTELIPQSELVAANKTDGKVYAKAS